MRLRLQQIVPALALALTACAKPGGLPVARIAPPGSTTVSTGAQVQLDGSKSDDGAGLAPRFEWSFSLLPRASAAAILPAGSPTPSFVADVPGKYEVQLIVRSESYASAAVKLLIDASPCGANRPTTGALAATPPGPAVHVPVSLSAPDAFDADNGADCKLSQKLSYAWTLVGQPAGSAAHLSDATAMRPSFVPDVGGVYQVRLVLTDDTGLSSAPAFLGVTAATCGGNAPFVSSISSTITQPTVGQTFALSAVTGDADVAPPCSLPQPVTYQWSVTAQPVGSLAKLNSTTVASPSFRPDVGGTYGFRLVVTDSTGLSSAPADYTVLASICGSAVPQPSISVPASASVGLPVLLRSTIVDDDLGGGCNLSQTLSYHWALLGQPAGSVAQLNAPDTVQPSFTPDAPGNYLVQLSVASSNGKVGPAVQQALAVGSCGTGVPSVDELQASPSRPVAGQAVHVIKSRFSDPNLACASFDPRLRYDWKLLARPNGSNAVISDPAASSADFATDLPGAYQISLAVTSSIGKVSAPRVLNILAQDCGSAAPSITSATACLVDGSTCSGAPSFAPDPGSHLTFSAGVQDADALPPCSVPQTINLRWTVVSRPPGSNATLSAPDAKNPTLVPDATGTYQVSVVAVDQSGLSSAPAFVTFTTSSCGTGLPVVSATPQSFVTDTGRAVPLLATPADPGTSCGLASSVSYAWEVVASPIASSAIISDPGSAAPTFTPDVAGDYTLSVAVTNARGARSLPAFVHVLASTCAEQPPSVGAVLVDRVGLGLTATASASSVANPNCDPGAAALRYRWSLLQRPAGSSAMLTDPTAAKPQLTYDVAGSYQLALTVVNGLGLQSQPAYATVGVPACGASTINFLAQPIAASFFEPDGTPLGVGPPNAGSQVVLSSRAGSEFTDATPGCSALPTAPYRYSWALVSRPAGSAAVLSSATDESPGFVTDVPGDYQVAVSVTDALGTVSSTAFRALRTSSCGANAPALQIVPPASLTPNVLDLVPLSLVGGSATDADNGAGCPARFHTPPVSFNYGWKVISSPLGGTSALSSASSPATTFEAFAPGRYSVQVVATASTGLASVPASATFDVQPCGGAAPSIARVQTLANGIASSQPGVLDQVSLVASGFDPNGACGGAISSYTFSAVSFPAGSRATTAQSAGVGDTLSFTPDVAGSYLFSVVATSSRGLSSAPFPVAVTTAACAPSFAGISSSVGAPVIGQQIALSLSNPAIADRCLASPSFSYAWTLLSAPPASRAILDTPLAAGTTFTPDVAGNYLLSLVVTDQAGNASAPATLSVPASKCSTAPPTLSGISASSAAPDVGSPVTLGIGNISDANGTCSQFVQPFSYRWTVAASPRGSVAQLSAPTDAVPSFVPDMVGAYQISAVVTDALGNVSAPALYTLTTSRCGANVPQPAIAGTPSSFSINANGSLALTASATDADSLASCGAQFRNPTFTYQWSLAGGPLGGDGALSSTTLPASTFTASVPGDYTVLLSARASTGVAGGPVAQTVHVSSCGGAAPQILGVTTGVAGALVSRPAVGADVTLTASPFDADTVSPCSLSETFTYAWTLVAAPAGSTARGTGAPLAVPTFTFKADFAGTYVFSVVVKDSNGQSSAPFTVTVPTGPCGPGLTGIVAPSSPGIGSPVALAPSPSAGSIPDVCVAGGSLRYAWSFNARPRGSVAVFTDASAATPSFTPDVAGDYGVVLVVTDAGGFSTSVATSIPAGGCTAPPTVGGVVATATEPGASAPNPPSSPTYAGDRITFRIPTITSGSCGTASSAAYRYSWALTARPPGSQATLDSATSATPSLIADVAKGTYQVVVVVTDALGNQSVPGPASVGSVTTDACGANPPLALLASPLSPAPLSVNAFAPLALSAKAVDNNSACPARFATAPAQFQYAWSIVSQVPGSAPTLSSLSGPGTVFTSGTPSPAGGPDYFVRLVATDHNGVQSPPLDTAIAVQTCGANAPVVRDLAAVQSFSTGATLTSSISGGPRTLDTNVPVRLGATVTDDDTTAACGSIQEGMSLLWALVAVPPTSGARLSDPTAAAPVFTPDKVGTYRVALTATDTTGLSSTATFDVVTGACGTGRPLIKTDGVVPQFAATQNLPDGTIVVQSTGTLPSTGSPSVAGGPISLGLATQLSANLADDDQGCLPETYSYSWALVGVPPASSAALSSATARAPQFTPDQPGDYLARLSATDSTGLSDTQLFKVTAACGTLPPMAANDAVNAAFSATQTVPSVTTTAGPKSAFQITRSTLASADVNDNVAFYPGVPVRLGANARFLAEPASCPARSQLRYAWQISSAPIASAAPLVNATSATPTFTPDVPGEYDVALTLTDPVTGLSSRQTFTSFPSSTRPLVGVSNCGQNPPAADIAGPPAVVKGTLVTLGIANLSDPDGVPLNLSVAPDATGCGVGGPSGLTYAWRFTALPLSAQALTFDNPASPTPSFTPPVDGSYGIALTLTDAVAGSPAFFTVSASLPSAANSALSVSPAPPASVSTDVAPANVATLTATIRNNADQPFAGVPVSFAVSPTTQTSFAGGVTSGVTDATGTFSVQLASTLAGTRTVTASFTSGGSTLPLPSKIVLFRAGAPTHLVFNPEPAAGQVINTPISPLTVEIRDAHDNVVTTATNGVTLSIAQNNSTCAGTPSKCGTLIVASPDTTPLAPANGVANFTNTSIDKTGSGYTLGASAAGLAGDVSTAFSEGPPTTPLASPVLTRVASNQSGSAVALQWTPVNGANLAGYKVYRTSTPGSGYTAIATPTAATTSFSDSATSAGTLYCYKVTSLTVVTFTESPLASSNQVCAPAIAAATPGSSQITVSWSGDTSANDPGATYELHRGTSASLSPGGGTKVATVAFNGSGSYSVVDNGVTPGSDYYFIVKAIYSKISGTSIGPVNSYTEQGITAPAPPGNLSATGAFQKVSLQWDPPAGDAHVNGYNLYSCSGAGCALGAVPRSVPATLNCNGGASVCFDDTGLSDGTPYSYAVSTVDNPVGVGQTATTEGTPTSTLTATTAPGKPVFSAASNTPTQIGLNWSCSGCSSAAFAVQRATGTNPAPSAFKTVVGGGTLSSSTTTFTNSNSASNTGGVADSTFTPGTVYTYQVISTTGALTTTSDPFVTETLPAKATGVTASGITQSQATISWTASTSGADAYLVERSSDGGVSFTTVANPAAPTVTVTDTTVSAATTYIYRVTATNSPGGVTQSSPAPSPTVTVRTPPAFQSASAGLNGGNVNALAFAGDGSVVYAGFGRGVRTAASAGIFASTNSGATWTAPATGPSSAQLITGIAVPAKAAAVAYAISSASSLPNPANVTTVFATIDSGAHWTAARTGVAANNDQPIAIVADPIDATGATVYIGGNAGVYQTTNGTAPTPTWTSVAQGPLTSTANITALGIDPTTSPTPTLYATTASSGVFQSTAIGAPQWSADNGGLSGTALNVHGLAVDARTATAVVYIATDAGIFLRTGAASWAAPTATGLPAAAFTSVAAFSGNVYATTAAPAHVWLLKNGAGAWIDVTANGLPPSSLLQLGSSFNVAVDPKNAAHALVGSAGLGGVYATSDAGSTFTVSNSGLAGSSVINLIYDTVSANLYANTDAGIFKSPLSPVSWTALDTASLPYGTAGAPGAIAVDQVGANSNLYAMVANSGLYKLASGATAWVQVAGGTLPDFSAATPVLTSRAGAIYAAAKPSSTAQVIYTSTDGGVSFTAVGGAAGLPSSGTAQFLGFDTRANAVDALTLNHVLYQSVASANWGALISPQITPGAAAALTGARALAYDLRPVTAVRYAADDSSGGTGGVFKSTDGGASWANIGDPATNGLNPPLASGSKPVVLSVATDPNTSANLYAGTSSGGFYYSNNASAATPSWTSSPLTATLSVTQILVDPDNSTKGAAIFIGTDGHGVLRTGTAGK